MPMQLTPLIGREQLISDVTGRLAEDRLVTLTGSRGVGKTRLTLAVAAEALDRFPGGAWLVEVAGLSRPDAVAPAVLAGLGGQQAPGADLVQQLAAHIGDEPTLVVLDNCERLVDECAALVAGPLAASSTVTVLATSREPLSVPGEVVRRVPSLTAPPPVETLPLESTLSQVAGMGVTPWP
jgi:predicted ATPase